MIYTICVHLDILDESGGYIIPMGFLLPALLASDMVMFREVDYNNCEGYCCMHISTLGYVD